MSQKPRLSESVNRGLAILAGLGSRVIARGLPEEMTASEGADLRRAAWWIACMARWREDAAAERAKKKVRALLGRKK